MKLLIHRHVSQSVYFVRFSTKNLKRKFLCKIKAIIITIKNHIIVMGILILLEKFICHKRLCGLRD